MAKRDKLNRDKKLFLDAPVEPFQVTQNLSVDELLRRMEAISFQGRNLATASRVWERIIEDQVFIFLGLAGALSAGGLRLTVARLVEVRAVDCLVSTGANLYHDLHETRGRKHFLGRAEVDDKRLQEAHIDRVYDTFMDEDEFIENDEWIADFSRSLESRPYTSREFLYQLGGKLWEETKKDGILTAAYRSNVPIFCPAIADSSIGMGLSQARHSEPTSGHIDVIGDIIESANLVIKLPRTASIVLGGGTPKNFINQASVQAEYYSKGVGGHDYAIQVSTDTPHYGGASGSSLSEAQSWGKLSENATHVTVHADATIALPLLATSLESRAAQSLSIRTRPMFELSNQKLMVDGQSLPRERFIV